MNKPIIKQESFIIPSPPLDMYNSIHFKEHLNEKLEILYHARLINSRDECDYAVKSIAQNYYIEYLMENN